MAQGELSKDYDNWALVIDEQELRRICYDLQNSLDKVGAKTSPTFTISFSDNYSHQTSSLEDLFKEENPRSRAITGLEIKYGNGEYDIDLRLGMPFGHRNSLSVKGQDRQWVYVTFSMLEDRLKRMKQWYPITGVWWLIGSLVVLALLVLTMHLLAQKYGHIFWRTVDQGADQGKVFVTGTALAVASALIVFYGSLVYFTTKLFPLLVFRIGDGIMRHDSIKTLRSRIFWAILVSIGLALLSKAVTAFLF